MLAIFDMDRAAQLHSRHAPALDRLAHELAIDECKHVDRLVEANSELASLGPFDNPGGALPIAKLDRDLGPCGLPLFDQERRTKRGDLADRTRQTRAGVDQHARVECALFMDRRRIVGPGETVSHDKYGFRG